MADEAERSVDMLLFIDICCNSFNTVDMMALLVSSDSECHKWMPHAHVT
jgi:hypothetical protein